jgi:hypothetical protein
MRDRSARPHHPRKICPIEGGLDYNKGAGGMMSSWNEPDFWQLPIMLVGSIVRHGRGGTYIAWDDERDSSDGVCRDLGMLLRSHSGVLIVCCETC